MSSSKSIKQLQAENKKLIEEIEKLKTSASDNKNINANKLPSEKKDENFYRTLFKFSPSGIIIEDKDGIILDVNPAWCKSLGYKRSEIVGQKVHKLAHPSNHEKVDKQIKDLLSGKKLNQTLKSIRKDGTECYIHLNERAIKLPNGEQRIFSISQDMTKETQSRKALIESEKTYRGLFDNSTDAIYVQDEKGRFVDVNRAVENMYGYPREFFIGKTPEPLSAPGRNDLVKISDQIKKAFDGEPQQFEFWAKRSNGDVFPKIVRLHKGTYFGQDVIFAFALDITDRKLAERELKESEEKFRILAEKSPNMIFINVNGKVVYVNNKCEEIMGYSKNEFYATDFDFMTIISKDSVPTIKENFYKHSKGIDVDPYEYSLINKKGQIVNALIATKIINYEDENAILGIITDITVRKKAEDALRKSEERFRTMFSQNSAVMLLVDPSDNQKIIDANKAAEDFYGYKRSQLLEMSIGQINIMSDEKRSATMKNVLSQSQNYFQFVHKLSDGKLRDVEVYASPIIQQEKPCMFVIVHDITKRKQAELEITRLATAVEQAVESIVITDVNGTIKFVNNAFEKITGYKKSEAIGQNPRMLKSGKHGKELYDDLWRTISNGKKWQGVIVNRKKNGTLYYERAVIFPLKNEHGEIINYTGILRDITLERKLEQQLQQVQKMEAIGTLSGGIAHDFNNILTVINGHAEIGLMNAKESDPVHEDLISILNAGKRAEKLTSQLLAFSRKQIHELKVIDMNQTIKDLDKMLRRLIPEDIKIISNFTPDLPYIKADPGQIEQVLINLIINARDAINDKKSDSGKKEINVITKLVDLDSLFVDSHPGSHTGPHIFLSVQDTGTGINEEVRNRVFEPFFTTKEVDKGTGLGLATVYGIIKQNDSSIYLESKPGEGTTFKIYWPVTTESPDKDYIERINQNEYSGKETILFVEDDEDVRKFACTALKSFGYNIVEAQNGRNAIQIIDNSKLSIDIIVTDLIMPEMNGQELAKYVNKKMPNMKVLFVSGYTFEHLVKDGEIEENINFLQKPYKIQNLLKRIRETLDNLN